MRRHDLVVAVVGALVAATLATGVAWATIPDGSGTISGCYLKVGGILRVIDTGKGQRCLPNAETPLTWSQTGPKGPQGDQGVPGPQGPQGPPGDPATAPTVTTYRIHDFRELGLFDSGELTVNCDYGDVIVGGGFDTNDDIKVSRPAFNSNGWYVRADAGIGGGRLDVWGLCLRVG